MRKPLGLMMAAAASTVLTASPARAAGAICDLGVVSAPAMGNGGEVWIASSLGWVTFCNITSSGYITADGCRGLLSMILSAKGLGKSLIFYFDTDAPANQSMTLVNGTYCHTGNFIWALRTPYFWYMN